MATHTDQYLARAREIVASKTSPIPAIAALRAETGLGLAEARPLIIQALDEVKGIYYLIQAGSTHIDGPHEGIEAALEACSGLEYFQPIMVVGGYSNSPAASTRRFVEALPDQSDRELVHRLLGLLLEHDPLMQSRLGSLRDRERLIDDARERLHLN